MFHLSSLETTNSKLAGALAAVGIPLRVDTPVKRLTGHGGDRFCFFFQEISPCGQFKTKELILAWNDEDWHTRNPHHPFAYIKVAFQNKEALTDYVNKQVPTYCADKNGKLAFLPITASAELEKKVFQKLKKAN
jgi:hypothetical protein